MEMVSSSITMSSPTPHNQTSSAKKLRAAVFGSTGATGLKVVNALLASNVWSSVTAVTRRDVPDPDAVWIRPQNRRDVLSIRQFNFTNTDGPMIDECERLFQGQCEGGDDFAIFYCLASTIKDAGSTEKFKEIDLGYLTHICSYLRAKSIPIRRFDLISAEKASNFPEWIHPYLSTKLKCEHTVVGIPLPGSGTVTPENMKGPIASSVGIWQPPLIDREGKRRSREILALYFSWLLPTVTATQLGVAMVRSAEFAMLSPSGQVEPVEYFQYNDIRKLAEEKAIDD